MPERRHFNAHERAALYLAAEGRCENCGAELEPGWHADHIKPYSAGGPTDVTNGQALCPTCNLKKGSSMDIPATFRPRQWQQRCRSQYHANPGPDFLCVACPGAGKTKFALLIALDLLRDGIVDRILVIVPKATLRSQWAKAAEELGIVLDGESMNEKPDKIGRVGEKPTIDGRPTQGWVITYASLASDPTYHRVMNSRKRTLVILDEVHHLGDEGTWGKKAVEALGECERRLSLSGTPFRSDGTKIPFCTYYPKGHQLAGWVQFTDDPESDDPKRRHFAAGFDYSYGRALADKPSPVRPVLFEMYDSDVEWFDAKCMKDRKVRLSQEGTAKHLRRKANRMALNPAGEWLPEALRAADERLTSVRDEGDPNAKGLVVCLDTEHAHEVAVQLARITGVPSVPVATSKDLKGLDTSERAKDTIEKFGESRDRWLVAVEMVSEGVDIPQLRVGVYATTTRTDLFFRQVIGRFVRTRDDLPEDIDQTAYMFIPKGEEIEALADAVAREVGDGLAAALDDDESDIGCGGGGGGTIPLFGDQFQAATGEAAGWRIPGGRTFDETVCKLAETSGHTPKTVITLIKAAEDLGLGNLFGQAGPATAVAKQAEAPEEPYKARLKNRKKSLDALVKQVANRRLRESGQGRDALGRTIAHTWTVVKSRAGIDDLTRADIPDVERAIKVVQDIWRSM